MARVLHSLTELSEVVPMLSASTATITSVEDDKAWDLYQKCLERSKTERFPIELRITPRIAKDMMSRNEPHNRKLNRRRVKKHEMEIRAGEFVVNGDTITITWAQRLQDGQHRVQGGIDANMTFSSFVSFGIDPKFFDTKNTSRIWTCAEVLTGEGIENSNAVSGAARWIISMRDHTPYASDASTKWVLHWVLAHPAISDAARVRGGHSGLVGLVSPSIMVACIYLFTLADPNQAEEFFSSLASGANLAKGNPILTLREKLIKKKSERTSVQRGAKLGTEVAWMINAWNAYLAHQSPSYFKGPLPSGENGKPKLPPIAGLKDE